MQASVSAVENFDPTLSADAAGWVSEGMLHASSAPQRATVRVLAKTYPDAAATAEAIAALAFEFSGTSGRRMQQFVWFLNAGVPIVEAIQRTPDLLLPSHCVALRLAEQSGRFQQVCRSLLGNDRGEEMHVQNSSRAQSVSDIVRLFGGLVVTGVLLTFFAVFILPTFQQMFTEFDLELPSSFRLLVQVIDVVPIFVPLLLMGLLLYGVLRAPRLAETWLNRWSPNRGGRPEMPSWLAVRSLLANAAEGQRPLMHNVRDLSVVHSQPGVRAKLQMVCDQVQQGQETWIALANQGLLSHQESKVLATAQSKQTQAWLLRWFVARRIERRERWSDLGWRAVSLVVLTLLAAIVGLAVISIFSALIGLIAGLA